MKSKKIKIPIYGGNFTIILFENDEELQNKFHDFEFNPPINHFDGGVFEYKENPVICFRNINHKGKKYPTPGIIAHEAKHLLNLIFLDRGQELDLQNDEAECYFLGWLVDEIHNFLK